MQKKIYILNILLLLANIVFSQKVTVKGYVFDSDNNEKIIGAIIILPPNTSVTTNEFGFYSIQIPKNQQVTLKCKYLGYQDTVITLNATNNKIINFYLHSTTKINEVIVKANRSNTNLEYYSFDNREIKLLPSLTGEKDALKSLQLLPGVQFGNEGTTDLYVRGGTPDQNLILLDDMPMHFVNHLGSFVSIFDINAVNKIKLIKSGFPAKYGGHLSSVLDIRLNDGNMKKTTGEITLGVVASKLFISSPIIKNKLSFIFTARKCNFDIVGPIYRNFTIDKVLNFYTFYDLNFKINYNISSKDKVDFLFYNGADINKMVMKDDALVLMSITDVDYLYKFNNSWGNYLTSFRWTHVYNKNIFQKFVIGTTVYNYTKEVQMMMTSKTNDSLLYKANLQYYNKITNYVAKLEYEYLISDKNRLNFGTSLLFDIYEPGTFRQKIYTSDIADTIYNNTSERILKPVTANIYLDYIFNYKKIQGSIGGLASYFTNDNYTSLNFQPDFSLKYRINKSDYLYFAIDKTFQNVHVLTMSNSIVPADIWVPATQNAQTEHATQYTVAFHTKLNDNFELAISSFYKKLDNLIDYKRYFIIDDTTSINSWEQQIYTDGQSTIYGAEILIEKNRGNFTGWISYTYMKNYRQYAELNNGEPFPFNYDRRHNLKVVLQYKLSDNFFVSSVFMYGSGYPFSLPIISQRAILNYSFIDEYYQGNAIPNYYNFDENVLIYNRVNSYRMPDYHRLDISLNWSKQKKKNRIRTWTFSVYNVYNQQNAYFLYITKGLDNKFHLYKYTLFPIIPSVSYSLKF